MLQDTELRPHLDPIAMTEPGAEGSGAVLCGWQRQQTAFAIEMQFLSWFQRQQPNFSGGANIATQPVSTYEDDLLHPIPSFAAGRGDGRCIFQLTR